MYRTSAWRFSGIVVGFVTVLTFASVGSRVQAATESILWSFGNSSDGANSTDMVIDPAAGLIADAEGNFYGTTIEGGAHGLGTVFKLSPPVKAGGVWTESVLLSFSGEGTDGANPYADLIFDSAGNLYGTTSIGGTDNYGTVFELSPSASPQGNWTETVLWNFHSTDGANPFTKLVMDASGNLYGTVSSGLVGRGGIFELSPPTSGSSTWSETTIWSFDRPPGAVYGYSVGGLILDSSGNLYGTAGGGTYDWGSVFELSPPTTVGGAWSEKVLWSFGGPIRGVDGLQPSAGVVMDSSGNLYGTTDGYCPSSAEYAYCAGTVFELSPPALNGGSWTETILYAFPKKVIGAVLSPVTMDARGNLFGTNSTSGQYKSGTLFGLAHPSEPGGAWTQSTLWTFGKSGKDGSDPQAEILIDSSGNLYSTTRGGGVYGKGTVFRISGTGAVAEVAKAKRPPDVAGDWTGTFAMMIDQSGGKLSGTWVGYYIPCESPVPFKGSINSKGVFHFKSKNSPCGPYPMTLVGTLVNPNEITGHYWPASKVKKGTAPAGTFDIVRKIGL